MAKPSSSNSGASENAAGSSTAAGATDTGAAQKKRSPKAELQEHVLKREVLHDGDLYAAGEDIALTRTQHAQLYAVGAVEEEWRA